MSASQITATIQQVAMAALNHSIVLVPEWLPDGRRIKSEWLAKNPARGDRQVGSFSVSLLTGKWHDFADNAAKGGDLVGLLAYLQNCKQWQAAQMIDNRLGLGFFKQSGQANAIDKSKQAASLKLAQERQKQAQLREQHDREAAKKHAVWMWQNAQKADPQHPYLLEKCVLPYGLRQTKTGNLLVPICFEGELVNLQQITPQGQKRFLAGGQVKGCYTFIGRIESGQRLYICEGWATGATLHQHTGHAIACALNAGNLKPVALALRARYGNDLEIVIAGDDDRQNQDNTGRKAANDAALAISALAIFPEWPPYAPSNLTDFNDLAVWQMRQGAST
jgi:putative DNA primase/helicase